MTKKVCSTKEKNKKEGDFLALQQEQGEKLCNIYSEREKSRTAKARRFDVAGLVKSCDSERKLANRGRKSKE